MQNAESSASEESFKRQLYTAGTLCKLHQRVGRRSWRWNQTDDALATCCFSKLQNVLSSLGERVEWQDNENIVSWFLELFSKTQSFNLQTSIPPLTRSLATQCHAHQLLNHCYRSLLSNKNSLFLSVPNDGRQHQWLLIPFVETHSADFCKWLFHDFFSRWFCVLLNELAQLNVMCNDE